MSCGNKKTEKETQKPQLTVQKNEPIKSDKKTILCFGDSFTAGLGIDDINDAYPGVLQQQIDSLNLNYNVINSGVSGETTAGGKSRIN